MIIAVTKRSVAAAAVTTTGERALAGPLIVTHVRVRVSVLLRRSLAQ